MENKSMKRGFEIEFEVTTDLPFEEFENRFAQEVRVIGPADAEVVCKLDSIDQLGDDAIEVVISGTISHQDIGDQGGGQHILEELDLTSNTLPFDTITAEHTFTDLYEETEAA
jgi:hypothetical protein